MNRRMRKKRKVGEFQEFGFVMKLRVLDKIANDPLFWNLLFELADSYNLSLGGCVDEMFIARMCTRGRCLSCDRRFGRDRPRHPLTSRADLQSFAHDLVVEGHVHNVYIGPALDAHHHTRAQYMKALPMGEHEVCARS